MIQYDESFFCGDSAGRLINPTTGNPDKSDSDIKFALNIGIQFRTPEDVFKLGTNNRKVKDVKAYPSYD